MKRRWAGFKYAGAMLAMVVVLTLLAACGGQNKAPEAGQGNGVANGGAANGQNQAQAEQPTGKEGEGGSDVEPVDEADATAATREFEHGKGIATIPVKPERIVAIQYTGAILALGVKPVGADNEWGKYPLLEQEWAGIEHVGDPWTGLNLEKIVALQPDLIITHVEATYEELSKIAPTLWIPWLQYSPPEQIALFGDILGRQQEAEAWLAQFDATVEQARADAAGIIGADETVAIFNIRPQNQFIYGNSAMGGYVIYELLGLKPPAIIQQEVLDQKLGQLEISLELLPEYAAADYVFLSVLESEGGAERAAEIQQSAIWQSLPAARNNQVVQLDWNTYFTTDPLSTMKQLGTFIELLKGLKK